MSASQTDSDDVWLDTVSETAGNCDGEEALNRGSAPAARSQHAADAATMAEVELLHHVIAALETQLTSSQSEVAALQETVRTHESTIENMKSAEKLRELQAQMLEAKAAQPCERCIDRDVRVSELERVIHTLTESSESSAEAVHLLKRQLEQLEPRVTESEKRRMSATQAAATASGERDALAAKLSAEQKRVQELEARVKDLSELRAVVSLKSEHVRRYRDAQRKCNGCKKTVSTSDWFCCHTCEDWNYCRQCFEKEGVKHAAGTHAFTDMSVFDHRVVNTTLDHITGTMVKSACEKCDKCKRQCYPYKGCWFRCNECRNFDFCKDCFEQHYNKHAGQTHTFTDMSSLVHSQYGFPVIKKVPVGSAAEAARKRKLMCDWCGGVPEGVYYQCNECNNYRLCPSCIIQDTSRDHSTGVAHTFRPYVTLTDEPLPGV